MTKIQGTNTKFFFSDRPDQSGQHLWFWQRATPRREPGQPYATVRFQGFGYVSAPRKTSPARARRRLEEKKGFSVGLLRDHEVGINPVYRGHERNGPVHKAWLKAVKAFETKQRLAQLQEVA